MKFAIGVLRDTPKTCDMLSDLLIEVVAAGGSVSFMHPLARNTAMAFWDATLAAASRNERLVLGAWDGQLLAGTVTFVWSISSSLQPPRSTSIVKRPCSDLGSKMIVI